MIWRGVRWRKTARVVLTFVLRDRDNPTDRLTVVYEGALPDSFENTPGAEIVAEGDFEGQGVFTAQTSDHQVPQQVRGRSVNTAGTVLLALAALSSAAGVALPLLGRVLHRDALVRVAVWALGAVLAFAAAATGVLLAALLTRDFGNAYVYEHSSRGLSTAYTVTALWAGNAGSLLLWLLLMSLFAVIAARGRRKLDPRSAAYLMAILGLDWAVLLAAYAARSEL